MTSASDLLELLRAAAGEGGMSGALGRWRQAVSDRFGGIASLLANPVRFFMSLRSGNVVVSNGATTNVMGAGNTIDVVATREHELIFVFFRTDRANAAAAGSGAYQLNMDGTDVGPPSNGFGADRTNVVIVQVLDMMTVGPHSFDVFVTATGGDETVFGASVMGAIQSGS